MRQVVVPKFFGLSLLLSALVSCAPSVSPETSELLAERGPVKIGLSSPSTRNLLVTDLSPFTRAGTVKSLGLEIDIPRENPRHLDNVVITDADYQLLHQAIMQEVTIPQDTGLRIGTAVARATFCRTGPIGLNNGITRWSAGQPADSRTPVAPVRFEGGAFPGMIVNLTCDATNPYMSAETILQARRPALTQTEFRAQTVGKTSLSFSAQHGTQVVYVAPNGASYLWYPGNQRIVQGNWRIAAPQAPAEYSSICFDYGRVSFDINTASSTRERCTSAGTYLRLEKEARNGDIFGLSTSGIPFVMEKDRLYTVGELLSQPE